MDRPGFVSEATEQWVAALAKLISHQLEPHAVPHDWWASIVALAAQHRLMPVLHWILKQSAPAPIEQPIWDALSLSALHSSARWMVLDHARQQVETVLSDQGIPTVWIKGVALACTVYPKPGLRPMSDLDVLVPYQLREAALKTATSIGYSAYIDEFHVEGNALKPGSNHAYTLIKDSPSSRIALDLHYRLGRYGAMRGDEKAPWFWERTEVISCNGAKFSALKPETHLLYLCAHAILHHGETSCALYQLYDMHQLITNREIDWDFVSEQAAALEWSYAVERALGLVVDYFGTPVPARVFSRLQEHSYTQDSFPRSILLQGKGARWEKLRSELPYYSSVDKIRLILKVLFPSKEYIYRRYSSMANRPIWTLYLYRWFDQGRELCWWGWRYLKHQRTARNIRRTSSDAPNSEQR